MRKADTYRGYKRNQLRDQGILRGWRFARPWMRANGEAKILERAKVCEAARNLVAAHLVENPLLGKRGIVSLLEGFWEGQPNSRVRSRILRDLAA